MEYGFPSALLVSSYLNFVLTGLSVLAMTCTIITYFLFSELRNLSGMAVMNLCIATIIFQTSLFGLRPAYQFENHWVCVWIAVAIHYDGTKLSKITRCYSLTNLMDLCIGLASFTWTNVLAADLYLTLSRWSAVVRIKIG